MSKHLMQQAIQKAIQTLRENRGSFKFCGITIKIEHAHSNQYQVLLPDGSELIRLVAGKTLQVLPV